MDSQSTTTVSTGRLSTFPDLRFATLPLTTGIDMHYAEYGDTARQPIVFLHGFTDSWFSFSPALEHLAPTHHVYMLDQRGHGNSTKPEGGYTVADFADDVIAFLNAKGLQQITLIGHSLGSLIAQRVACLVPERVTRLVLIGSAANPYTEDLAGLAPMFRMLEDPVSEQTVRDFQVSTIYGALNAGFFSRVVAESMKVPARVWRSVLTELLANGATASLEHIQARTLVLWGDQDAIWSHSEQEALRARIPTAQLIVYPQTGHALHWEQPTHFVRDLEAFIAQTS